MKKIKNYLFLRQCKRCFKFYKTPSKRSKYCPLCYKKDKHITEHCIHGLEYCEFCQDKFREIIDDDSD